MKNSNPREFIHLVYSDTPGRKEISVSESRLPDQIWGQLELFASEKPDAMIFAQPDRIGFEGIVNIIAMGHVRRIFDLREMPFISFGHETREGFLSVLQKNRVEYFNVFNLRHTLSKKEYPIANNEELNLNFKQDDVKRIFKPMIESGPTVIFSDCAPSEDKAVKQLLAMLTQAGIPYTTVYADSD